MADTKLVERNIPGMNIRASRFAEVEHAENAGATLRRLSAHFTREKGLRSEERRVGKECRSRWSPYH